MKKKAIIFSPHPDDETLACGGTIAKKLREGYEITIVFMTDGRHSLSKLFGISSDPSPIELKEIRREEAKKAAKILGLREENLFFLDFEDGTLKESDDVINRVSDILSKIHPNEIYFPWVHDLPIDHKKTNLIVSNSLMRLKIHTLKYQYVISPAFLPLSPAIQRPLIDAISKIFRSYWLEVDITEFIDLKRKAINAYQSQISIFSQKQSRPVLDGFFLKNFSKNKEKFLLDNFLG